MDGTQRKAIIESAADWDARLRAPGCTQEERDQFSMWREANPTHAAAFERLQMIASKLRAERSRADLRSLHDAALALGTRRRKRIGASIAASIAFLAIVLANLTQVSHITSYFAAGDTYQTVAGQRSSVTLEDGSILELSSRTRLRASITKHQRSIELLSGQAIFKVAHDSSRPFVVRVRDREIVALGTAFDVRVDDERLRVTLLEGKVAVRPEGSAATLDAADRGTSSTLPSQQTMDVVILMPGQQLTIDDRRESNRHDDLSRIVQQVNVEKATGWREGRIFLDDLSLREAVEEMNRNSATRIVIDDPALELLRVNGMFRAGEQQAFAHALEEYFPIAVDQRGDRKIVLKKR